MQVGKDCTHEQRFAVVHAFNLATLENIKTFAKKNKLGKDVDFKQGNVLEHLPVISFACTDAFAAALQKEKLPGVGQFIRGGFTVLAPVNRKTIDLGS